MLNYIWGFMILIGVIYGAITGNLGEVGNGAIDSAKEAVTLSITMLGIMSMWTGLMNVAKEAGLIEKATSAIRPVVRWLFPDIPAGDIVQNYITTNLIANILGLGWAATPAGLKTMREMKRLNNDSVIASKEMCMFLVLNISSLQIIPITMIAYRSQYGAVNPSAIIGPAILATSVSTAAGVIFAKVMSQRDSRKIMRD
ncbi:MAG: nucleoside recognition protein [Eubacterium sp.]